MCHLDTWEIKGDDFAAGKAPAGHGVGAVLAHTHLVAPAAAVKGVGAAGDGNRPAPRLGGSAAVRLTAGTYGGYGAGSVDGVGLVPRL